MIPYARGRQLANLQPRRLSAALAPRWKVTVLLHRGPQDDGSGHLDNGRFAESGHSPRALRYPVRPDAGYKRRVRSVGGWTAIPGDGSRRSGPSVPDRRGCQLGSEPEAVDSFRI